MIKRRLPRSIPQSRRGCKPSTRASASSSADAIVSTRAYANRVWEALDTPVSLGCYLRARNGMWADLVKLGINASDYADPYDFYLDYQAVKLMSKCVGLPTGIDTELAAKRKFIECEVACRETNSNFACGSLPPFAGAILSVMDRARTIVDRVLGEVPSFEQLDCDFGPGATTGVRIQTSDYNKLYATPDCTLSLLPLLPDFLGEFPGWFPGCEASVAIVQGSELTFVPKDAKTDRPICIEPLLNGFGQKGFGSYIRDRLARWGVNLRDQTINQRLAAKAQLSGLATVDFSSASDTIAYLLIWNLLPTAWAEALDNFRCPRYTCEGEWYNFQKFSSMGNAYTFELETLVFFSLAVASMEQLGLRVSVGENVHVYGDDVIIPEEAFDLYQQVTTVAGFTVNRDKSFRDGSFFESCGADYFNGQLVTPLRQKNGLTVPEEVFLAANNLVRMAERLSGLAFSTAQRLSAHHRCTSLAGVHLWTVRHLRQEWRVFGPAVADPSVLRDNKLGDTHIWCPWSFLRSRKSTFGYRYKQVVFVPTPLIPQPWLQSWEAYRDAEYPHAGLALYRARSLAAPVNGWLSDDIAWTGNIEGYTVRKIGVRKRLTVWASEWSFPDRCWGYFFSIV